MTIYVIRNRYLPINPTQRSRNLTLTSYNFWMSTLMILKLKMTIYVICNHYFPIDPIQRPKNFTLMSYNFCTIHVNSNDPQT